MSGGGPPHPMGMQVPVPRPAGCQILWVFEASNTAVVCKHFAGRWYTTPHRALKCKLAWAPGVLYCSIGSTIHQIGMVDKSSTAAAATTFPLCVCPGPDEDSCRQAGGTAAPCIHGGIPASVHAGVAGPCLAGSWVAAQLVCMWRMHLNHARCSVAMLGDKRMLQYSNPQPYADGGL